MNILWLAWKDIKHPQAGGAEVVGDELRKRLIADGHQVTVLTAKPEGMGEEDSIHGYRVIRVGGRFSVYWHAYRYYKANLQGKFDLVIDEINTIPFFARWYVKERNVVFIHQLARQIWFYQMPFPVSLLGYLLEPIYLRLLRLFPLNRGNSTVITVSESTRKDMLQYGYKPECVHIISEGITITPMDDLSHFPSNLNHEQVHKQLGKYEVPTLLALGAMRPMKRTLEVVKAFEKAKFALPNLRLILAGSCTGDYGEQVSDAVNESPYKDDITFLPRRYTHEEGLEFMQRAHVFTSVSVREGWGLVITEANAQGTPAVVYDVHGLRDSVRHGVTGMVAKMNTPAGLADGIVELLHDEKRYEEMRHNAWQWSKEITFDRSYKDLKAILGI